MSDSIFVDSANETAKAARDFMFDVKKFIVAVINTSITYGAIVGLSVVDDVGFDVGQYRVTIKEVKYGYDNGNLVRRNFVHVNEDKSEAPVTVYSFKLSKQVKFKGIFGGEKIGYEKLLFDHFSEPKGNGPRNTELYRWDGQEHDKEFNYFEVTNIAHIRDYLDTVKAITESAQAYVTL